MLHLIPAPLHRAALRAGYRVRRWWWRWRRPDLAGVAVIALDGAGRVLLVRLSYGPPVWSLPAGGRGRREDPAAAAQREFFEELGCGIKDLRLVLETDEPLHGARDIVHVYAALVDGVPVPDGREVVEARFFARDELPERLERRVRGRLALLDRIPLPLAGGVRGGNGREADNCGSGNGQGTGPPPAPPASGRGEEVVAPPAGREGS